MDAAFRTRRELEARFLATHAARRRDPNLAEIVIGVTAFLLVASACLYLVAAFGR